MVTEPTYADRRLSFGAEAVSYSRYRPGYPAEAIDWILSASNVPPLRVADVGAGTGALTASLIARGLTVDAVEPDADMLDELCRRVPQATPHQAPAEHLPLGDASVDAVLAAQAWHWFDHGSAADEFARVVRPGGVLGLMWNLRFIQQEWMQELAALIGGDDWMVVLNDEDEERRRMLIQLGASWSEVQARRFHHAVEMTPSELVGLVSTFSYVRLRSDAAEVLASVDELARTHAALVGRDRFPLPYVTVAYRSTRA